MLQMYTDDLLVVGVTRGNIDRLTAHRPMKIDLVKPVSRILVVFGEDKPAIVRELEAAGMEFADVHKAAANADPL